MQLTATHRFARSFDDVWAVFVDPEAHVARHEHLGNHDVHIVSATPDATGLDIVVQSKVEGEVPAVAKKFIKPVNTVTTTDRWELHADGTGTGHSTIDIKGAPVTTKAVATLVPPADGDDPDSCTYTIVLDVSVNVPLVGGRVAGVLKPHLKSQLEAEFAATEAWLAAH